MGRLRKWLHVRLNETLPPGARSAGRNMCEMPVITRLLTMMILSEAQATRDPDDTFGLYPLAPGFPSSSGRQLSRHPWYGDFHPLVMRAERTHYVL